MIERVVVDQLCRGRQGAHKLYCAAPLRPFIQAMLPYYPENRHERTAIDRLLEGDPKAALDIVEMVLEPGSGADQEQSAFTPWQATGAFLWFFLSEDRSRELCHNAIEQGSRNPNLHIINAVHWLQRGDAFSARVCLESAVQFAEDLPPEFELYAHLASAHHARYLGQRERVRYHLRRSSQVLREVIDERASIDYLLCVFETMDDQMPWEEARAVLVEAVECADMSHDHARMVESLLHLTLAAGRYKDWETARLATQHLDALKLSPDPLRHHRWLWEILLSENPE